MILATINTKGGVGKSVVATQYLAGYLYKKNNQKVRYIEVDDQNKSIEKLTNTEIIDAKVIPTESISTMIHDIILSDEDMVLDIGGNLTAALALQKFRDVGGVFGAVTWFIPMLASDQDTKNAEDTYNLIREFDTDGTIVFVLNNCLNKNNDDLTKEQFLFFYGNDILSVKSMIDAYKKDKKIHITKLNSNTLFNSLGLLKKTAIEIAETTFEVKELILKARNGDEVAKQNAKQALYMAEINTRCKNLLKEELEPFFKEIDKLAKGA